MKKKFRLLTILACVFAFCMTAFIAVNVNEAKAAGESYTLSFRTNDYDIASSDETWTTYNKATVENGVATLTRAESDKVKNYGACVGKYTVTAGKTYSVRFKAKAESMHFLFAVETPAWTTLLTDAAGWVRSPDEFIDKEVDYTPSQSGDMRLIFQLDAGVGNLYIKDFYFCEKNDMAVTAGSAIGTLPEVPAKDGCDGYWTIDGEKITAETVYNYGADKVAVAKYAVVNKLTFLSDGYEYDMAANGSWADDITDGVATISRVAADETKNYRPGAGKFKVEAGQKYRLYLSVKTDSEIRFVLSSEKPNWSMKFMPDSKVNNPDFVDYVIDYVPSASGDFQLIFQLIAGEGNIYIKNFRFCKLIERKFESETAIGELPAIPEITGYDSYWTIDGEKITAETVYNYGTNKTAVPVYERNNRFTVAFQAKGGDMAASAESWNRYKMPTFENGVATLPRAEGDTGAINYAAGVSKYNVEAGKAYKLELKLKADNIYIRFSTERPDYNAVFIDGWTNNADYVAYSFDYTATATGPVDFIFQLTAGTGNVCIKDFYFYENVTKEVEGGTAIGELPVIPEVAGYANGRWEIDGEKITAETVYDYGENKTAVLVYDRLYNLEFRSENYKIVGGEWVYNQPQVTEAGEYLMTRDPELETGKQVNYATGCKFKTEADKTYVLNLSVKCDNTFINLGFETFDGTDTPKYNYFYTKWTENVDYVDYVIECKPNVSGESWILFTLSGGGGEIYVKNMSLYEKVASKNLLDGAAVGELPALNDIPVKHGFEYCWTIDGAKITAETVFNYGKNKVAAPSMLTIEGDHTLTKVEAVDSTCTENGVKEYYVCACGKNFADENGYNEIADLDAWKAGDGKIAAKGHTAVKVDGKAATCEEEGFKDYYNCSVCGKNFTDETCATEIADLDAWKAGDGKIAAKGHTAVKVDGKAATCKEAGYKDYYNCSVCGKNFTDETCATEIADLDAWKAGDGKLDLVNHTATKVDSVAATCTANGVKEYYHCSVCDKNFADETCATEITDLDAWKAGDGKIAAKGHVAATEWNSDENGHWHNCETCGEKMNETAGVHADENGDGKCDVCGYEMGKEPSGSESKETPTESSSGSGKESSDGGCFSGINGVVGLTTLAILAAAAVILVKRKEN